MKLSYLTEIPFRKVFRFLAGFSFVVQLLIITYNHFSGYAVLTDYTHFLTKLVFSTILTFIAALMITIPDMYFINLLNARMPWSNSVLKRLAIQAPVTLFIAVIGATIITLISHAIHPYENGLFINLLYNALIVSVCNILLMITLEAWLLFVQNKNSQQHSLQLQRELSQIRFEVLKNQINPHFMFNSLNVLSALIEKDPIKAQRFIDEFSKIYRYVLETIEKPLVAVNEELEFLRSFMFLQQIRHGNSLKFTVDLPSSVLDQQIPPFAFQVIAENACKHNEISADRPLHIDVRSESNRIVIANTLQPKTSGARSSKVGQKNLITRYQMISDLRPQFRVTQGFYKAILPLVNQHSHENTDH